MNILIVGSGGREHTMAWKISQSNRCDNLYLAPGNAGTSQIALNVPIQADDFASIAKFIKDQRIGMLVVGPEVPLVDGIRDYLEKENHLGNLKIIGPGQQGAQLEGSKDFAKRFMQKHRIPTAKSKSFTSSEIKEARQYLENHPLPIVLKADGLAAGKGVIICDDRNQARKVLEDMLLHSMFGTASNRVVIEEFLKGIELSVFVLTDGKHYKILPEAKDYKPIGENNTGPNTGGMGSVSPVGFAQGDFMKKVEEKIIKPTTRGLQEEAINYKGFIFFGLINVDGEPYVIEYNVRMGDPETQVVLPRIKTDLVELLEAVADGTLDQIKLDIDDRTATTVVMVSGGYPGNYKKGEVIKGYDYSNKDTIIFHAGTKAIDDKIVTNGGRVLAITGLGSTMKEALQKSYDGVGHVTWKDVFFRKDIGQDLLALR